MVATLADVEKMSIFELEEKFEALATNDSREAAEIAFAVACHYHGNGDPAKARRFARESIRLFKKCDTSVMTKCLALHHCIAGIELPDFMHEGVVEFRTKAWGT